MTEVKDVLVRLQREIEQCHSKQQFYRYKLEELNNGRTQLANEIDLLSMEYDKKVKHMQSKIKNLASQNDGLLRQNEVYKVQIETFNTRLLEKQKFISLLVAQQGEKSEKHPLDLSRSEKNEENRSEAASEGDTRFKKNVSVKPKTYQEDACVDTVIMNQPITPPEYREYTAAENKFQYPDKPQSVPVYNQQPGVDMKKNRPLPPKRKQEQTRINANNVQNVDIPAKNTSNESDQIKKVEKYDIPRKPPGKPKPAQRKPKNIPKVNNQIPPNIQQPQTLTKEPQQAQTYYPPQYQMQADKQLDDNELLAHFKIDPQEKPVVNNDYQHQETAEETVDSGHQNFLSHFENNQNTENAHQEQSQSNTGKAKKSAVKKPPARHPPKQDAFTSNNGAEDPADYFNKLSEQNNPAQPNQPTIPDMSNSDIQQSSIDYQQNSLMSSAANVFSELGQSTVPHTTMTKPKKKARRDKVKVFDPSSFD